MAAMVLAMIMTAASCGTTESADTSKAETAAAEATTAAAEDSSEEEAPADDSTYENNDGNEENDDSSEYDDTSEFLEEMENMIGEDEEVDLSKAFEVMAGEYVCTYANTGIACKNMERATVRDMFKGTNLTVTEDGVLEMNGSSYQLTAHEPHVSTETYLLLIDGNGCEYENNDFGSVYANEDLEGPSNIRFIAKGQDIGFNDVKAKDTIEIFYSPAGTDQWYYDLEFCRVGEEDIGL